MSSCHPLVSTCSSFKIDLNESNKRPLVRGFDTCLDALVPQSCGVLMSNTGYLGPPDLDEFDKVITVYQIERKL